MTLDPADLDLVRRHVTGRSAIQLEAGKEYLIESRLETLARVEGLADATAVVDLLRRSPSGPMGKLVIDAMTTNETSFFRDRLPFDALRTTILPKLIAARSATRRLNIWCAACSMGQEPYSIAMTIRESFPELVNWRVDIIATDISPTVLEKASSGRFSQLEVNRGLPAPMLMRYFDKDGARWKVKDQVRSMIDFRELNLIDPWPAMPRFDVVFLRNVMIYFDVPARQRILSKVSATLARDGYLFLGAGESTLNVDSSFRRVELDKAGCFEVVRADPATSPLATPPIPTPATNRPLTPTHRGVTT